MTEGNDFYWRHARDSLLTRSALQMFQILASHEGEEFDSAKETIDEEYFQAIGKSGTDRHGGMIQTQLQVFREAGWVTLDANGIVVVTPAGHQALVLLTKVPDFIKAAPYFVVELLARYQLNNPARPATAKNESYDSLLQDATIFPYWTLLKLLRSLDDYLTADELRRFVFKIRKQEEISATVKNIRNFRKDLGALSEAELDSKYGAPIEGSQGEPKYLMGRLGTQVGRNPPLLEKEGVSKWILNKHYHDFVDSILAHEPVFKDHLTEDTWMTEYGAPVDLLLEKSQPEDDTEEDKETLVSQLADDDQIFVEVKRLVDEKGSAGVLLSGPPGTGKTWYAGNIAAKLVEGDARRVRFLQFHPSLSYDDFIEGVVPVVANGATSFEVRKKLFMIFCDAARQDPDRVYVLVIDEINRGDASNIFGELLTYIEPAYRGKTFRLAYSGKPTSIPANVFLIGTFNPYDRSVTELDDAFDRRFDRISIEPDPQKLRSLLTAHGAEAELVNRLTKFFVDVNKLSRHGVGHAVFLGVRDDASLARLWQRKLKFLFEKAFKFEPEAFAKTKEGFKAVFRDATIANSF